MNEEEKEAIENLKEEFAKHHFLPDISNEDLGIALNLIENQKAEIELMAEHIATTDSQLCEYIDTKYKKRECKPQNTNDCIKCIIEYFTKLAEEEK